MGIWSFKMDERGNIIIENRKSDRNEARVLGNRNGTKEK